MPDLIKKTRGAHGFLFLLYKNYLKSVIVSVRLWKESLNSDGHQCHQYQQNGQSSLILTELTEHKKDHHIWHWKSRTWLGTDTKMSSQTHNLPVSSYIGVDYISRYKSNYHVINVMKEELLLFLKLIKIQIVQKK